MSDINMIALSYTDTAKKCGSTVAEAITEIMDDLTAIYDAYVSRGFKKTITITIPCNISDADFARISNKANGYGMFPVYFNGPSVPLSGPFNQAAFEIGNCKIRKLVAGDQIRVGTSTIKLLNKNFE